MIACSLTEIAAIVGGRLTGGDAGVVTSVVIDSREVVSGGLFVAISGEQVDGANFIPAAFERGAVAALTSVEGDGARILVEDPRTALSRLAAHVRAHSRATVVAITGSVGKTLTKDLTAAAVATQRRTVATPGNFNNELGVPLTICRLEEETQVLVAEVGARGIGHIASLMPMLAPDVSVVLNVGDAHIGEFGDLEATARAKRELVEGLAPGGVAILNADDERVRAMRASAPSCLLFGTGKDADIRLVRSELDDRAHAIAEIDAPGGMLRVRMPLPGEHVALDGIAALAVAHALGLDLSRAATGIEHASTSPGRMRLVDHEGWTIIDDAYNASPGSMRAALKTLAHLGRGRPSWAVLGAMAELGDRTIEAHDGVGRLATRLGIGHVVAVGADAAPIARAAVLEGMSPDDVHAVDDRAAAVTLVRAAAEPNAVLLVKASHAARLDLLVAELIGAAA